MPYWTKAEEDHLKELVEEGKSCSIEELCKVFKRSPEACRLKICRLGLVIPESKKEVSSTPTPQHGALEPIKPVDGLISEEEAVKMWLGCIKRLNEPGLSGLELKRLRLTLSALDNPEKHGESRPFKISPKLAAMINSLPKKSDKIFGDGDLRSFAQNFRLQRKKTAQKLQNPRLHQIHFHTLRHWKATVEFAKTKNILYVMKLLGHKRIENTLVYTQLINFESDEWHVAHAKTLTEEDELIKAGFEFIRYDDTEKVAIYRKRK